MFISCLLGGITKEMGDRKTEVVRKNDEVKEKRNLVEEENTNINPTKHHEL